MSDEPKKHTRAVVLWACIALVVLAYTLSIGPVGGRIMLSSGDPIRATEKLSGIYAPVRLLCEHSRFVRRVVLQYMFWWST